MVAWAGVEHYNRGMIDPPPPIDEPLDAWVNNVTLCSQNIYLPLKSQ